MAVFTDKQLLGVVAVGVVGVWLLYRKASQAVEKVKEVGEASAYLGEYYVDQASDYVSDMFETDEFDKKWRGRFPLWNDEQYEYWKAAVKRGDIELPPDKDY